MLVIFYFNFKMINWTTKLNFVFNIIQVFQVQENLQQLFLSIMV